MHPSSNFDPTGPAHLGEDETVLSPALTMVVARRTQARDGWVHLELRNALTDLQTTLPPYVQSWLSAPDCAIELVRPSGAPLQGVALSAEGGVLGLKLMSQQPLPEILVLKLAQEQVAIRLVQPC